MDLSIIIVNYNVKYFLELCLHSVIKATQRINAEIFVIDNASTDGSKDYIEKRFPSVKYILNAENTGFGKANNSVIPLTKGRYILFLNPDTVLAEDTLQLCIAFADKQQKPGAIGIRMIDGSGKYLKESKRSFPSASASVFKMAGLNLIFPRSGFFSKYYAGNISEHENNNIEVVAGAFMMVSRKAIEHTKGFDEDFFMYGEDIDLSYRITQAGMQNFYFADSTIIHFKGESMQRNSAEFLKHFYGAMELFVQKHLTGKSAGVLRTGIRLARTAANVKHAFRRNPSSNVNANTLGILATQKKFDHVLQLVKHAGAPYIIKGRIAVAAKDPDPTIGKKEDLQFLVKRRIFNHLLLCNGELSFREIIQCVQDLKSKVTFMFHANESDSIVSSGNKNQKGTFISFPSTDPAI